MEVRLRGWSRDHGPTVIGQVSLDEGIAVSGDWQRAAGWDGYRLHISDDSIDLTWRKGLRLTGDYRVDLIISKEEINQLFRLVHNGEISEGELSDMNVNLIDVALSEDEIHKAIKKMRIGEFLKLLNDK
jgi:hypothetical protein